MTSKTDIQKKEIVIPGEIIAKADDILPGDWTMKQDSNIVATRLGIVDKSDKIIKIIPITGVYMPRGGNTVIGEIKDIAVAGWQVEVGGPYGAFLPLRECAGFIETHEMESVYGIGDLILTKVLNVGRTSVDLTMKSQERGSLGKVRDGIVFRVNAHRVPRIIGKEGSMVKLIKDASNCNVTVAQNGIIWITGEKKEDELFAKKAVEYIVENVTVDGLTEKVEAWLKENKNGGAK